MIEVSTPEWESLRDACESLGDPRTPINIFHPVENIVAISLAAIVAGAEGPKSMARWTKSKNDWPHGSIFPMGKPCHSKWE